ncbi:MAG: hypothetical protein U9R75_00470 [Candidatus Thermoplasmatota archaeon]|nr:hypothetical protein [Candidatus Thermoplasmatota archaeon]
MKIKKITIENALSFGEGDDKLDFNTFNCKTLLQEIYTAQKTQTLSGQSGAGMKSCKDVK